MVSEGWQAVLRAAGGTVDREASGAVGKVEPARIKTMTHKGVAAPLRRPLHQSSSFMVIQDAMDEAGGAKVLMSAPDLSLAYYL